MYHLSTESPQQTLLTSTGQGAASSALTCVTDLLEAQQAEDAVVQLHLLLVALVHLVQDLHQLITGFGGVATLGLVHGQLVEGTQPRAANPLVFTLRYSA